jgi:glycosyltransferase involved in cell wall biosynthesis
MNAFSQPLVSVITPVYNDARFLAECIESVLSQTYQNWTYTIVNNRSTDGSAEIARWYAAKDSRIRVHDNEEFLPVIRNHNHALQQISPRSKYCKMVFADDFISPTCLSEMVAVAEQYPSIGIVGAYGLEGKKVMWTGLPYPGARISGRDACRLLFLDEQYVFGTATSVLYRSDLVRDHVPFFNESNIHADMESSVTLLKTCDFGFVHQILTFRRVWGGSISAATDEIYTLIGGRLHALVTHGRAFLSGAEFRSCLDRQLSEYYNYLSVSLMRGRRDKRFWDYHKNRLNEAGIGFRRIRLAQAIVTRLCRAILNPIETIHRLHKNRSVHASNNQADIEGSRHGLLDANEIQ